MRGPETQIPEPGTQNLNHTTRDWEPRALRWVVRGRVIMKRGGGTQLQPFGVKNCESEGSLAASHEPPVREAHQRPCPPPGTRNPNPETRNPNPGTRILEPGTWNPEPGTRNLEPETWNPEPGIRNLESGTRCPTGVGEPPSPLRYGIRIVLQRYNASV